MNLLEPKLTKATSRPRSPISKRAAQQRGIAEFGSFAVEEAELQPILDKAASLVCDVLDTDLCKVLQLLSDTKSLLLVSGCGLKASLMGKAIVGIGVASQAGYALKTRKLVISEDMRKETRFQPQTLLVEHGIISGMSAPLYGEIGSWGVLSAHSKRKRRFTDMEIDFLQSVANVLSGAIRRAEQAKALREADQNLRSALEVANIGTWRLNMKTRIGTRDANLNRIHGSEPIDSSHPLDDMLASVHPDDRQLVEEKLAQALTSEETSEAEYRIVRLDGSIRWLHSRGRVMPDGHLAGAAVDVTERKEAEQTLARFGAIIESSQDAIISVGFNGVVTSWNHGAEKMFGYSVKEMVGQSINKLLPESQTQELLAIYEKLRRGERVEALETTRLRKDGRLIRVSTAMSVLCDEKGRSVGVSAIVRDITRRCEAEYALREEQSRLRIALEAGRMGTWDWHIPSGKVEWSPNLEQLHGKEPGTFNGTFEAVVEDIDTLFREPFLRQLNEAIDSHTAYRLEYRLKTGKWVEARGQTIYDQDGKAVRMMGVCIDITQRREAERALRESEERFRQLADAAPALIWMANSERRCTYFNRGWLAFRGKSADHEMDHGWLEGVHPEDREQAVRDYQNAYEKRQPLHQTYRLRRHDGEYRCLFCSAVPRVESDGRFVGYIGSAIDITDIRKAEQVLREQTALQASESRFRELADAMPHIVWGARPDGYFDYFNKRWHDYTGITVFEGTVDVWRPVIHPDDWPHCLQFWEAGIKAGEPCEAQCRFRNIDSKEYRWHLTRVVPIKDQSGHVVRWIGSATDIHDQKQAEADLAEAKEQLRLRAEGLETAIIERTEELQNSLKTTETLLYTIAHDLRAPLRAMQGLTAAVVDDYGFRLDKDGQEYLERIDAAAKRMDQLISDLLAYGRMGHVDLPVQQLDLEAYIAHAVSELSDEIKASHAEINVHSPLPQVKANTTALTQVLVNVIGNAVKFVAPGTKPRVEIFAKEYRELVRVFVQDNGIGIDAAHQERIFHVFQRLHTVEAYSGTGIGLAIAAKAVERMGGKMGVESEPGKGSCFWFELPR